MNLARGKTSGLEYRYRGRMKVREPLWVKKGDVGSKTTGESSSNRGSERKIGAN